MQDYTTNAIEFSDEVIADIILQFDKWSVLATSQKLVWLNNFYKICLTKVRLPYKAEVVMEDSSCTARQFNGGIFFGRTIDQRELASVLYLFFHEFHHVKMYFLKRNMRQFEIFASNPMLEVIATGMEPNLKIFEEQLQNSIYKLSPHEFSADKFAKNCLMHLFKSVKDKKIQERFLNEIKNQNADQHQYLNKIKETIGLQHLDKENVLPQIAELKAESEMLKKLKP